MKTLICTRRLPGSQGKRDTLHLRLTASSRGRALLGRGRRGGANGRDGRRLLLALGLRGWRVPVVGHLRGDHSVQREARHEGVQDQRIVHLLQGREDAGERAEEVVEDLCRMIC